MTIFRYTNLFLASTIFSLTLSSENSFAMEAEADTTAASKVVKIAPSQEDKESLAKNLKDTLAYAEKNPFASSMIGQDFETCREDIKESLAKLLPLDQEKFVSLLPGIVELLDLKDTDAWKKNSKNKIYVDNMRDVLSAFVEAPSKKWDDIIGITKSLQVNKLDAPSLTATSKLSQYALKATAAFFGKKPQFDKNDFLQVAKPLLPKNHDKLNSYTFNHLFGALGEVPDKDLNPRLVQFVLSTMDDLGPLKIGDAHWETAYSNLIIALSRVDSSQWNKFLNYLKENNNKNKESGSGLNFLQYAKEFNSKNS